MSNNCEIKVKGIAWNTEIFIPFSTRAEQQVKFQGLREHLYNTEGPTPLFLSSN